MAEGLSVTGAAARGGRGGGHGLVAVQTTERVVVLEGCGGVGWGGWGGPGAGMVCDRKGGGTLLAR